MVSFTGSTAVGRQVAAQAAGSVKRVHLELGGKAPFVVFDDADLEAAAWSRRRIPHQRRSGDLLVLLAVSLAAYWWAQRSGFRTEQLDRALAEDCPSVAAHQTTGSSAAPKAQAAEG